MIRAARKAGTLQTVLHCVVVVEDGPPRIVMVETDRAAAVGMMKMQHGLVARGKMQGRAIVCPVAVEISSETIERIAGPKPAKKRGLAAAV